MTTNEDFKLHEETLTRWINSCDKEEQLPICEFALQNLIVARFHGLVDATDLMLTVNTMRKLMEDKQREIKYYSNKVDIPYRREIDLQTTFD
jgi:hypothetical protein